MKLNSQQFFIVVTLFFLLSGISCFAQGDKIGVYKMTTPVPPGIAIPDKVATRFGTLNFFDGFPDNASTQKIFDNLDFQRAVQAYLLALPPVELAGMRKGLLELGPANYTVSITETLLDSHSLFLTGNTNTVYSFAWLDLHGGPLVFEAPPNVLGFINDMWGKWVVDVGITGLDKGKGGMYLILPPGYNGTVPEGYLILRPGTFNNWLFWRSFLVNGDPKPGVDEVKKLTRIYRLSDASNPPAMKFVNISDKVMNTVVPADYSSWETLNKIVQEEPSESLDPVTLGFFASIGIEKGKQFAPDARMKQILTEAAAVGDATARALTYRMRQKEAYYYPNSAWRTAFLGSYKFEENGTRNPDSAASFSFYGIGVTPAMTVKMIGQGSQYAVAFVDSNGNPLDGGKNYTLHLPTNIPIKEFWSIILYDDQTRTMLQTDQRFPMVSSQNKGLLVNADGSVDVYFGPKAPNGKEINWVQTIPGKGWSATLRLYSPLESWFDKTWRPGEIELQP
jgi:hypothetical protein